MNKTIKIVLLIAGIALLGYGIYALITPEASLDIGILKVEEQNNNNAYVTIGLGLLALVIGFIGGKRG